MGQETVREILKTNRSNYMKKNRFNNSLFTVFGLCLLAVSLGTGCGGGSSSSSRSDRPPSGPATEAPHDGNPPADTEPPAPPDTEPES